MVNPTRDKSGSNLISALRRRLAASRDSPPDAVGKLASCLIDCCVELRCIIRNQVFGGKITRGHKTSRVSQRMQAWAALPASSVERRFDALHASRLTELVGREEELELLLRRWSKAQTGEGQTLAFR